MALRRIVFSACLSVWTVAASAAPMTPEQATVLIAKAQALDAKCNVLAASDRQVLSDLVARAEIALAEKVSVEAARRAMKVGTAEGKSETCDAKSRKLVMDTFQFAKSASMQVEAVAVDEDLPPPVVTEKPKASPTVAEKPKAPPVVVRKVIPPKKTDVVLAPAPEAKENAEASVVVKKVPVVVAKPETPATPVKIVAAEKKPAVEVVKKPAGVDEKPVVEVKPQRNLRQLFARTDKKRVEPKPKKIFVVRAVEVDQPVVKRQRKVAERPKVKDVIAEKKRTVDTGYAALAEDYYRELRCRKLSTAGVNAMYARVLAQHRAAIAKTGKAAVRSLLQRARARASSSSC